VAWRRRGRPRRATMQMGMGTREEGEDLSASSPSAPRDDLAGASALRRRVGGVAVVALVLARQHVAPRIITLVLISITTFAATDALGIDVARKALGREVSPGQLAAFRKAHGLDKPLVTRYVRWLEHFVSGDWGTSPLTGRLVRSDVAPAFTYTAILAVAALIVAVPLSLALGVYTAKRPHTRRDAVFSVGTIGLASAPIYVIGILLILVFGVKLQWAPVDSTAISFGSLRGKIEAYILPTLTVALSLVPHFSRMTRTAVRETVPASYVRAAVLRGLPRKTITTRYLLPNAAAPIINVVAIETIWLLGGVIIVENVFGLRGIGQLLVAAIGSGDLISVQAIAMLTGVLFITISLAADLLVLVFNPRLRRGASV
jgi:peptide/nickel transport system permease protein